MVNKGRVLVKCPLPSSSLHMHRFFICLRSAGICNLSLRTQQSEFIKGGPFQSSVAMRK
jgi:hypothetical protein